MAFPTGLFDWHALIAGKHTQGPRAAQGVVDGPRRGVGLGPERVLPDQPGVQGIEQGLAFVLAHGGVRIGRMLPKGLLKAIQGTDALKSLLRWCCRQACAPRRTCAASAPNIPFAHGEASGACASPRGIVAFRAGGCQNPTACPSRLESLAAT